MSLPAEAPLFLMYTSGTTAQPKDLPDPRMDLEAAAVPAPIVGGQDVVEARRRIGEVKLPRHALEDAAPELRRMEGEDRTDEIRLDVDRVAEPLLQELVADPEVSPTVTRWTSAADSEYLIWFSGW